MSENVFSFEEQFSNKPQESIDILAQPSWKEFCDEVKNAEADVAIYDPTDNEDLKKVNSRAVNLSGKFGYEHNDMPAKIIGLGYNSYYSNGTDCEPTILDTDKATFHGVDLCFFNGRWRAMLEFFCKESTDDMPHGIYHVLPDADKLALLNIELAEPNIVQKFHEDYCKVTTFVLSGELTGTPEEQRKTLNEKVSAMNKNVPQEYRKREIVVECAKYYTAYDGMHDSPHDDPTPGFDLFSTDLSDTPSDEHQPLIGVLVGFEYPELTMLPPDQPLSADVLDINSGSYCLVLRSDKERATHYVMPQTIVDIF